MIDARKLDAGTVIRADVCIVGSGAAGATLAAELVGSGHSLVCLEAGGWRQETAVQDTCRGAFEQDTSHDPLELVRQKRIGGTTWQWGGRCFPLDEIDFEDRGNLRGGWPISRDGFLPYYRRAHEHCELGRFDYNLYEAVAAPPTPLITAGRPSLVDDNRIWRWSPPVKFGRSCRRLDSGSRDFTLYHHANVTCLQQEPGADRVCRALVAPAPGRQLVVEAKIFILATGCLEAARLLLMPSARSPQGIGNEHDLVGRYYMTHPVSEVGLVEFSRPGQAVCGFYFSRDGVYCRRMMNVTQSAQRELGLLNLAVAPWYPDPRDPSHGDPLLSSFALVRLALARSGVDWKSGAVHRRFGESTEVSRHLANVVRGSPEVARFAATWVRRRWLSSRSLPSFMLAEAKHGARLRFDAEQSPEPENRVTLDRACDAFGVPRIRVRHRVSQSDRDSIQRSLGIVGQELKRSGTARVEVPTGGGILDELEFKDGTHQMGVTRMADSPRRGVVDRDCRVHGAPNLFVASSAVFPTSGFSGPTLTIVALAIRIADTVRRELRAPMAPGYPHRRSTL